MAVLNWRFPILDGGAEQGINDGGIATFKGSELYDNLAREICQNSLDAKAADKDSVRVEFTSYEIEKDKYDPLLYLDSIFSNCREYWKDRMEPKLESFLNNVQEKLGKLHIDVLTISDYNTTGLNGAKASPKEKSVWRALTHSNGVTEKSRGSGGSHGIGKNAPFACSDFRTVFYNSYANKDNLKAFQGVSRLITHYENGKATQGQGFYQNIENQIPIFEEDSCPFRDLFSRKQYGTDVIILGFKKTEHWEEDIEKAIIRNFFVAINNGSLEVLINNQELNKVNLASRIKYYSDKEKNTKEKNITQVLEFYSALSAPDYKIEGSICEDNDVSLYIKKDDSFSKSIAEMRSIGMVVRTRHHNILTRYAAVMIVKDGKLNDILKSIEPPEHDKWDPGIIEEDDKRKEAEKYRKKLIRWVNDSIIDYCRNESPDEMDLDGVSAYLPFDEDDPVLGEKGEERDISPDADTKTGDVHITQPNVHKVSISAKKVPGVKKEDFDPHNSGNGGQSKRTSGGEPNPNGNDKVTAPNLGGKSLNIPKIEKQRIVQTPIPSIYRAVLKLEEDCPRVQIAVNAYNDDGTKEKIKILQYKLNKKEYSANSEVITLHNIKADDLNEVFLTFEYSEKMKLELMVF